MKRSKGNLMDLVKIGLLSGILIMAVNLIALNVPHGLSPKSNLISSYFVMEYEGDGSEVINHKSLPPAPEVGTTVFIYRPLKEQEYHNLPVDLLRRIAEKNPKTVYKDIHSVSRITFGTYLKLVYWGKPLYWKPKGDVKVYLVNPSGEKVLIKTLQANFPKHPPSSTELIKIVMIPIPLNLFANTYEGLHAFLIEVNVNILISFERGVDHVNGYVESLLIVELSKEHVKPVIITASNNWVERL